MKLKEFGMEQKLSSESVDRISERIGDFLTELKTERKEAIRIRLSVESILMKWQERFGEDADVKLSCYIYLGQPTIRLKVEGDPFDPIEAEKEDGEDGVSGWSRRLLSDLRTTPMYSYSNNANFVTFKLLRKHLSPLFLLLFAIVAAVAVGGIGAFLPDSFREFTIEKIVEPICATYLEVLNFFGIPLIFLSVVLGVCGIGDASFFEKIGKKMIGHFMLSLLVVTLLSMVAAYPFFDFSFGSGALEIDYNGFLTMLLGFLPTNLFTPFIDCNAMQLIIMGIVIGIALLKLNPIGKTMMNALDDLNGVLLLISQWFTRLIPFFVFAIIVKSLWKGEIMGMLDAWRSWVLTTGFQLVALFVMILQICIRRKVSVGIVLRKTLMTFLIAFGTDSCTATIPQIYECCGNLGVSPRVVGFGVPIGTSIYKPSTAIRFVVLAYFMATTNDVTVSVEWFVMVFVMAFLLSIAVPAIPNGAFLFYPMMFTQLGLPLTAITAMVATDIFFDAPCTAFCQVSAELALVQQADKLDLLDDATLRKV